MGVGPGQEEVLRQPRPDESSPVEETHEGVVSEELAGPGTSQGRSGPRAAAELLYLWLGSDRLGDGEVIGERYCFVRCHRCNL